MQLPANSRSSRPADQGVGPQGRDARSRAAALFHHLIAGAGLTAVGSLWAVSSGDASRSHGASRGHGGIRNHDANRNHDAFRNHDASQNRDAFPSHDASRNHDACLWQGPCSVRIAPVRAAQEDRKARTEQLQSRLQATALHLQARL